MARKVAIRATEGVGGRQLVQENPLCSLFKQQKGWWQAEGGGKGWWWWKGGYKPYNPSPPGLLPVVSAPIKKSKRVGICLRTSPLSLSHALYT